MRLILFLSIIILIGCGTRLRIETTNVANASDVLIPSGAVIAFDLSSCPNGWSEYSPARGRTIIGSGEGNLDKNGDALTARSLGETGGDEISQVIAVEENATTDEPSGNVLAVPTAGNIYHSGPADTTMGGGSDGNMPPFVSLLYCKKN